MAKNIADSILEDLGIKYEDLNFKEKESYYQMLDSVKKSVLTPAVLLDYIQKMKFQVEQDLIDEPEFKRLFIFKIPNRKQIFLKARMKNYMLLEAFLLSPKKAEESLKRVLKENIK